jgi:hypothetical protein
MNKIKTYILQWIFNANKEFFIKKSLLKTSLREVYEARREDFESFLIEDFTGHIPRDVNEPAMKVYKESSETIRRWVLWQSHIVNKKSIDDQPNLLKWKGMMLMLRFLYSVAESSASQKPVQKDNQKQAPSEKFSESILAAREFSDDRKEDKNAEYEHADS